MFPLVATLMKSSGDIQLNNVVEKKNYNNHELM